MKSQPSQILQACKWYPFRVEPPSIGHLKSTPRDSRRLWILVNNMSKLSKRSGFVIYSYFKDSAFTTSKRDAKFCTGYVKREPFAPLLSIRKSKRPKSWRSNSRKARQLCCWIRLISSPSFSGSRYQVLTSAGLPIIERKKEKIVTPVCSFPSANPQINYWEKNRHLKMSR